MELEIMSQLNHPNLLPLAACILINDIDIRLVTPYMVNGNLSRHLTTLEPQRILPIALQIAYGTP